MQNIHSYPKLESTDLRVIGERAQDGVESQLLVIQTPFGYRRTAELYAPQDEEMHAAILYIHMIVRPGNTGTTSPIKPISSTKSVKISTMT